MKRRTRASQEPAQKMTAEDATRFDGMSGNSIIQIADAIEDRKLSGLHLACECEPYEDVFTFNRWLAQGFAVRKGEKALRLETFVPARSSKDDKPADAPAGVMTDRKPKMFPRTLSVFCRCQVDKKEPEK